VKKFDQNFITLSLVLLFMDTEKIKKVLKMNLDYFSFFKTYYCVKYSLPLPILNTNNRRNIIKARKNLIFEFNNAKDDIEELFEIYRDNVQSRSLDATHAFSLEHFKFIVQFNDTIVSVVKNGNRIESFYIWVKVGENLYNHHLSGSTNVGKKNGSSHLCLWESIQYLHKNKMDLLLGSNSGSTNDPDNGLSRFKKSYSNFEASTYICGIILNEIIYDQLNIGKDKSFNYFPLYRFKN
jgi:lipid II:glycine glycyltransferase (peptidoglycan interpeptide bridge formation enzyme)